MKRKAIIFLLLELVCFGNPNQQILIAPTPVSGGTTTAIDTFVRANANPISNPMSDGVSTWTTASLDGGTTGVLQIFANQCTGGTSSKDCYAAVATPSIGTKQYSEITVVSQGGADFDGGLLYMQQGGTSNGYRWYFNGSATQILLDKLVSGTPTTLKTWTVSAVATNDIIRVRVTGGTFTLSINGSDTGTALTGETTYTSGQPGAYVFSTATKISNFKAGTW